MDAEFRGMGLRKEQTGIKESPKSANNRIKPFCCTYVLYPNQSGIAHPHDLSKRQKLKTMNDMQEFEIEIFNASGQQQNVRFSDNTPDLSELPSGYYKICFRQGNDTYTDDLIKE